MKFFKKGHCLFTPEEANKIVDLGMVAAKNLDYNDKRVANALHEALEILKTEIQKANGAGVNTKPILKNFESLLRVEADAWPDMLISACLNTGQYDRGLEICDTLENMGLFEPADIFTYRVELLAHLGRTMEAADMVEEALVIAPNNINLYRLGGDIFYVFQMQDEKQDLDAAEDWYYRAYDRGLAHDGGEDAAIIMERLGDVCIDKLRLKSEKRLLNLFKETGAGTWRTLCQLKESVRCTRYDAPLLEHLTHTCYNKSDDLPQVERNLQIIHDAYNLMPQDALDGLSPFEMETYLPKGEQELRLREEMMKAYSETLKTDDENQKFSALESEAFNDFQITFYNKTDPVTGKKRRKIIDKEKRKTAKDWAQGKTTWLGFLAYRAGG